MRTELAKRLVECSAIAPAVTELYIHWNRKKDEFEPGPFTLKTVLLSKDGERLYFEGVDERGRSRRFLCEEVTMVDGMDTTRFAALKGFYPDGRERPKEKRRGRKPRHLIEAEAAARGAAQEADLDDDLEDDDDE
jgi:hypothetical protein